MNLDDDPARETVTASWNVSFDHTYQRAEVVVLDDCGGERRLLELAPPGRSMFPRAIQGSRALGRPGVLFKIGYSDGHWIARVARLRRPQTGGCPEPAALFDYSTASPPRPPPTGRVVAGFGVTIGEYSRIPGRELRLTERYGTSPSHRGPMSRRTYFRYLKAQGRYVGYRTVLTAN